MLATLDSKFNINKHINVVCKKANTMLSFIRRNLHTQLTHIKSQAYRMYIRPILEYSSTVWAPYTKCNIDKLEAIQRRVARYVMDDYSYNSSVRRNISRLIIFYKNLHKTINITLPDHILPSAYSAITRGHNSRFNMPPIRINAYKYSFFPDTVRQWNSLPATFSKCLHIYNIY